MKSVAVDGVAAIVVATGLCSRCVAIMVVRSRSRITFSLHWLMSNTSQVWIGTFRGTTGLDLRCLRIGFRTGKIM